MRAQKRDMNEPSIVMALLDAGCSVDTLPGGNGRPDLLVGFRGVNYLIEVKDPSAPPNKRKLNSLQKKWHAEWKAKAHLVETVEQALMIVGVRT